MPGGKPVTEMPGLKPRSPLMADAPALVTVAAANTANDLAAPRFGAASVLATRVFDEGTPAIPVVGGLAAPTVVAKTIASGSIAKLRILVVMNGSCLNQ
jgi:hypothetical protein